MADCSKTIEFSRELNRLCDTEDRCGSCGNICPLIYGGERTCPFDREITQEDVDILQKWSDEHPIPKPKTYADDFFDKFPGAKRIDGRPALCREKLYGTPCHKNILHLDAYDCLECWNEVMPK